VSEQDKEYLRDLMAGFALAGLLMRGNNKLEQIAESAYSLADDMLESRKPKEEEQGIVAIRKRKVTK
jgi:predicted Zn-dependent peptidase